MAKPYLEVYSINEQLGKRDEFIRIGAGFFNANDSITIVLNAHPVGRKLYLKKPSTARQRKVRKEKR